MATPISLLVILVIQAIIIWIGYPMVFSFVTLSFKKDIARLKITLDRISSPEMLQHNFQHATASNLDQGGCVCPTKGEDKNSFLGIDTNIRHRKVNENNILKCCPQDDDTIRQLIRKTVQEYHTKHKTKKTGITFGNMERNVNSIITKNRTGTHYSATAPEGYVRPLLTTAVHLTGPPNGFTKNKPDRSDRGKIKVGPWESEHGQAFTKLTGVDEHHMVAPHSGLYFIYSQAYFRDEREKHERQLVNINEYLHYTVLDSTNRYADPVTLLKSGQATEWKDSNDVYFSSYHAGLFRLQEGDSIYMKVFLPGSKVVLDSQQASTYMGMYWVSTDMT